MLVDEVTIELEAGHGGRGGVSFHKVPLMRGPNGGDGARGGSIYFEGVLDINALATYQRVREVRAQNGKNGRGSFVDGKRGEDTILKVPVGTTIISLDSGHAREITRVGERILGAGGGNGGRGNYKFRSSTNTTPMEFEEGVPGDKNKFRLELRLIADVGLIGFPNAGKSTLLNTVTSAKSKIGNYAFTTLEPHLGSYYGLILADIPGLIEGASEGKGLGVKFLKHVERTKVLFHLVSAESEDPVKDYKVIRAELEKYSPAFKNKPEHVLLTKIDVVTPEEVEAKIKALKKIKLKPIPVSVLNAEGLESIKKMLNTLKDEKLGE